MTAAHVTLCFLLRDGVDGEHVLLGTKTTGFGRGKVVGVGGHVEPGETALQAVCREVMEEISVVVEAADLIPAGIIDFVLAGGTGRHENNSADQTVSHSERSEEPSVTPDPSLRSG